MLGDRALLLVGLLATACAQPTPDALYARAAERASSGQLDAAIGLLNQSFEAGHRTPSNVRTDDAFHGLFAHPEARERLRSLLKEHARESTITMVSADEPGARLVLGLRIVDETSGEALAGAVVQLVHVDLRGYYAADVKTWNPRLFGLARTNRLGQVEVHTIRPGHYASEYEADDQPAHIHYNIEALGYRPFGGEILFDDDPRMTAGQRAEAHKNGFPIAVVRKDAGAVWRGTATIELQPR